MRELAVSSEQIEISNYWSSLLFTNSYFLAACVDSVHKARKVVGQLGDKCLDCAQVVFATGGLRTTSRFVRSLYEQCAQASAQYFCAFSPLDLVVVPIIPRTYNKSYKKEVTLL